MALAKRREDTGEGENQESSCGGGGGCSSTLSSGGGSVDSADKAKALQGCLKKHPLRTQLVDLYNQLVNLFNSLGPDLLLWLSEFEGGVKEFLYEIDEAKLDGGHERVPSCAWQVSCDLCDFFSCAD